MDCDPLHWSHSVFMGLGFSSQSEMSFHNESDKASLYTEPKVSHYLERYLLR